MGGLKPPPPPPPPPPSLSTPLILLLVAVLECPPLAPEQKCDDGQGVSLKVRYPQLFYETMTSQLAAESEGSYPKELKVLNGRNCHQLQQLATINICYQNCCGLIFVVYFLWLQVTRVQLVT